MNASAFQRPRPLARFTFPTLGLAAVVLLGSTGCVAQREVDQYQSQYRLAQEQLIDLQAVIEDKDAQIRLLRGEKNPNQALQAQIAELQAQRDQLEADAATLRDQLARAGTTPIPVELADALEQLAQDNPDLMSYDSETGAIRFRSDVTFGLGSADVRDTAKPIINKLANVLTSPSAREYEVRVVGHTDNVPMKNALNTQRYGDNWGLSTARAISVMQEFRTAGISEQRMSVGGYGEFRPVEANGPRGSEANRRVEIFLVPMPGVSPGSDTASSSTAADEFGEAGEMSDEPSSSGSVVPMDRPAPPSATMNADK